MQIAELILSVPMDPRAHFDGNGWEHGFTLRLRVLTDRRIAFYQRQGRYWERRGAGRQNGNRLVHSA